MHACMRKTGNVRSAAENHHLPPTIHHPHTQIDNPTNRYPTITAKPQRVVSCKYRLVDTDKATLWRGAALITMHSSYLHMYYTDRPTSRLKY